MQAKGTEEGRHKAMQDINILVVDDEEGMRSAVQRALHEHIIAVPEVQGDVRIVVQQAACGEEALRSLASCSYDLMLLDYKLPDISGIKVLERLPESAKEILVIMITAYASIETAVKATRQGAHDFLPKPFTPSELRHAVRKAAVRIVLAREARRLHEEKKRVRFEFIRVLGHELKAPLGAVESYLDLLKRRTLGSDIGAYTTVIERSGVRLEQMRKLIVDLLDMTKIESGQRQREFGEFDVLELARQTIDLLSAQAAAKDVRVELSGDGQALFRADRSELEMILNNLVSNAIKYNREHGQVSVSVERAGEDLRICVHDTGIGMSEEERAKLFREFSRIKNEKTRNILGSGLGLSIVKRLVEMNGGTIAVESEPDKGSTFRVELKPAAPEPSAEAGLMREDP